MKAAAWRLERGVARGWPNWASAAAAILRRGRLWPVYFCPLPPCGWVAVTLTPFPTSSPLFSPHLHFSTSFSHPTELPFARSSAAFVFVQYSNAVSSCSRFCQLTTSQPAEHDELSRV